MNKCTLPDGWKETFIYSISVIFQNDRMDYAVLPEALKDGGK